MKKDATELAKLFAAADVAFPPVVDGAVTLLPDPFPAMDVFVREFSWTGNSPKGSWVNPVCLDYEHLMNDDDPQKAGEYTLNATIRHLSGEEQVKRLRYFTYDDIDKEVLAKRTKAAVIMWALEQGYTPPDIRAEEYIYHHRGDAELSNPAFFTGIETYRKDRSLDYIWPIFAGSIVRGADGTMYSSALWMGNSDLARGGDYLRRSWSEFYVFAYLETCFLT